MTKEVNVLKPEPKVEIEATISGDQSAGYEFISKLVSTLVDLKSDGFFLQVKLIGVKKEKV